MNNPSTTVYTLCSLLLLVTNSIASIYTNSVASFDDSERNITALINENGDKHRFFYDGNERLIKEIGFDGRVQEYGYNPAGHLIQYIDAGEVLTAFERDALGRLIEASNDQQQVQFQYDPRGNVVTETHASVTEVDNANTTLPLTIQHQVNALGQRTQTTLPDGQVIRYDYDATLAFSSVRLNDQLVSAVQRDSLGREQIRHQGALTTQTEYDPQGRLQRQHTQHQETNFSPIQREYGYDPAGNLNLIKDGHNETKYVYDSLNRLKLAASASPEFFAFDPAGNLLSITDTPTATPGLVKGNRLQLQGDKKFEYDARGNLTHETRGKDGKLQKTFIYNLNNQLIQVQSNQRDHVVAFKYDPLGRRIAKQDTFGTTQFLWADNLLLQEQRNHKTKTYLYEPGSFRPLAQIQDNRVYHYHLDHLGTPRELTNDQGKIVWKAKYKTYGNLALKEVDDVENNLRFQGQYYDQETGLHYNRFRYYSPDTGQFINQDPIGLLGGLNSYQYAANPTGWVDPFGLACNEVSWNEKAKRWQGKDGKFKTRPDSPEQLLQSGQIDYTALKQWADQGNVPNTWVSDPSKFPSGGFKYEWRDANYKYKVWGHGPNPSAPIGSYSISNPTMSMSKIPLVGGPTQVLLQNGTWASYGSNMSAQHIHLINSPF